METPICDFVKEYADNGFSRFHMPGHKGRKFIGCEKYDITEIDGADVLSHAEGIIKKSQENAAKLFGSGASFYSTVSPVPFKKDWYDTNLYKTLQVKLYHKIKYKSI